MRVPVTASELANVDVVFMKQFEPKVAQRHRLFGSGVNLMSVATTCHDGWKVVARVVGCVAKVAANDDGGVIQQRSIAFLDGVHVAQEPIEMFDNVDLNSA